MSQSIEDVSWRTHEVFNQSPPFAGHNVYSDDPLLKLLGGPLDSSVKSGLDALGAWAGRAETLETARLANRYTPLLKAFDSKGQRVDLVEFHPAWHELMRHSIAQGMHCSIWEPQLAEADQRYLARAIRYYITASVEMGHLCPITMTNACVAALQHAPDILNVWLPMITSRQYDPSQAAPFSKRQVILGMGMTEKQGGTDVRANTTRAEPAGEGWWRLTGHKWFMSVPQSDAFLVLAQMPEGLGCFLIPRLLDNGQDNGLRFQRLKDKLGNRSNASSEVEFHHSLGQLIGSPGRGVQTIIEMVTLTRLDCAVASAGLMRAALWEAHHHCCHRSVMGRLLIDQPLMRRVLADMAVDVAAATVLSLRLAQAFDRSGDDESEAAYARLMTPVIKYWTCKIAPALVYEAMECLGGNGYVEEGNLARHYREAPLNAIWEGSGNVMCLDILRVLDKNPEALQLMLEYLGREGGSADSAALADSIRQAADQARSDPGSTRVLAERLALAAGAIELRRAGLPEIAQAFGDSRLRGAWRHTYGMIDAAPVQAILATLFH